MTFWEKYYQATKTNGSYVCVGLDSDLDLLPEHLKESFNPIWEFNRDIINQTSSRTAAYKLNFAFYLAAGKEGLEALQKTVAHIPDYIPVIIDCKIGDIANTMGRYARAFFEEMGADAITVNPLMGEDVITPLRPYKNKYSFILAVTSNPTASDFLKKNALYRDIVTKIADWGSEQFGAVIGATNPGEMGELRKLMPDTLFLVPGIGAQGGDIEAVMKEGIKSKEDPLLLINSSRGIIFRERSENFAKAASEATEELRQEINKYI